MIEAFGSGTAATLAPVEVIQYDDVDYKVPVGPENEMGSLTKELLKRIQDIQVILLVVFMVKLIVWGKGTSLGTSNCLIWMWN